MESLVNAVIDLQGQLERAGAQLEGSRSAAVSSSTAPFQGNGVVRDSMASTAQSRCASFPAATGKEN